MDEKRKRIYIKKILKILNIESKLFFDNVAEKKPYELLLKNWILDLYNKSINVNAAANIVQKKRIESLKKFNVTDPNSKLYIQDQKKILNDLLELNPTFKLKRMLEIENTILNFLKTDLYTNNEILNFIQKIFDKKEFDEMNKGSIYNQQDKTNREISNSNIFLRAI